MTDKKAQLGEQVMAFVFIFFIVLIGGGIVIGTFIFIGPEFDFKGTESAILNYKIKDCFLSGYIDVKQKVDADGFRNLLLKECNINKDITLTNNLIKICIAGSDPKDCINEKNPVFSTLGDFTPCGLIDNKFLGCSIESTRKDNVNYVIIATSKQGIRRV